VSRGTLRRPRLRAGLLVGLLAISFGLAGLIDRAAATAPAPAALALAPSTTVEPDRLTRWLDSGHEAVRLRLDELASLRTSVEAAAALTDAERTDLLAEIDAAVAGLGTADAVISSHTSLGGLEDDLADIVAFRVFSVLAPKVHLVLGSRLALAAADEVDAVHAALVTAVDAAEAAGEDVEEARGQLDEIATKSAEARWTAQAALTGALPLTPAGYPDNGAAMTAARDALVAARASLGVADGTIATLGSALS
jgi:hypothetical protein